MTTSIQLIPYLAFDGICAEAMRYYEKVLGGTIKSMLTAGESPMADQVPADYQNMVLYCLLELPGGSSLYGCDCAPHMLFQGYHGSGLNLNFESVEEGEAVFNQLAEDGHMTMPYAPMFWAEKFGMVTDKFGVHWNINGALKTL